MKTELKKGDVVLINYNGNAYIGVVYIVSKNWINIQYDFYYFVTLRDKSKVYKIGEL